MTTDARISRQDFKVSAGKATGLRSELPDGLGTVAWYVGGTLTDVDDLTGATAVAGTADGDDTVWSLPAVSTITPVRMTVDGVPVTVGNLYPSGLGSPDTDTTLTLETGETVFTVTLTGVPGPPGAEVTVAGVEADDGNIPAGPLADALNVNVSVGGALWGPTWEAFVGMIGWENLTFGGLCYQASTDDWVMIDLDAEAVTVVDAPAEGRPVTVRTALDLRTGFDILGPGVTTVQPDGSLPDVDGSDGGWLLRPGLLTDLATGLSTVEGTLAILGGTVTTLGNTVADLDAQVDDRWIVDALIARAQTATPPTAWLECGGDTMAFWACPTTIPTPTTSMLIRTWTRFVVSTAEGANEYDDFAEDYSESHDGMGDVDRFEIASRWDGARLRHFWEHLEIGQTQETSRTIDAQQGLASDLPIGAWHEKEIFVDFAAGTITYRVRVDVGWDYEASDGTRWATTRVFEKGSPLTMQETAGHDQWIGRAPDGVQFDVARVRRWDDEVLVLDANPATGTPSAGTLDDSVLLDDAEDPAVWTASGSNVIATP